MRKKSTQFDVAIIGSGPAGMTAALWSDELKMSSCVIEREPAPGGQLHWIHNPIRNYPGVDFADGSECARRFARSLKERTFEFKSGLRASAIDVESLAVDCDNGEFITAKVIILATGVRRRPLGVRGEAEYQGRGILASGSRDRHEASGAHVAVIGGGDAALENALILADHAERVYLIHRRDRFSARDEFVNAVTENKRIETIFDAEVKEFGGSDLLEFADLDRGVAGSLRLPVSKAVVRIGVKPNSELLGGLVAMDDAGYVKVDKDGRSSNPNIYAIGDVSFRESPTIATAVGSAAAAVKSIAAKIR